ncbi:hypothetical protein [Acinetobacter baumannii]|uniref:hypothetical protein n=1 Tax=Acinetobacter baumannii TaxID=470 RepID=UPI001C0C0875|nr:hypothetical protein [Acinetobacter baumannii]MBU3081574.1 hypothetical protein [Acinetobacter baumannii]
MYIIYFLLRDLFNFFSKKYIKKPIHDRFYYTGFTLFIFSLPFKDYQFNNLFLLVSFLLISLGFISWVFKIYKEKIKGNSRYTTSFWLINIFIVWLSNVFSQYLLTSSLGLPPTDFILTLNFWTFICYVPACLFSIMAIGFIIYFPTAIILSIQLLLEIISNIFEPFTPNLIKSKLLSKIQIKYNIFHFIGFFITISILLYSTIYIYFYQGKIYYLVKYTAFYTDYKVLYKYPDIDHNHKVVLHANNIYSIAIKEKSTINIFIKKIE